MHTRTIKEQSFSTVTISPQITGPATVGDTLQSHLQTSPPSLKDVYTAFQNFPFKLKSTGYVCPIQALGGSINLFLPLNMPFYQIFIPLGCHPNAF